MGKSLGLLVIILTVATLTSGTLIPKPLIHSRITSIDIGLNPERTDEPSYLFEGDFRILNPSADPVNVSFSDSCGPKLFLFNPTNNESRLIDTRGCFMAVISMTIKSGITEGEFQGIYYVNSGEDALEEGVNYELFIGGNPILLQSTKLIFQINNGENFVIIGERDIAAEWDNIVETSVLNFPIDLFGIIVGLLISVSPKLRRKTTS